ncbi:DUF2235 domain-containing protein, partial [Vibrio anguillarum]|nr:DUF2235 domain-containing protein [Vibrio anguillarum]
QESDYVEPEVEFIEQGKKEGGRVVGRLYIQRKVEGELSRVYLRLMYGLAEYHGVPVADADGFLWQNPEEYLYIVKDFTFQPVERFSFSLEQFSQQILDMAKQGQYTKLESEFDAKRKQELM